MTELALVTDVTLVAAVAELALVVAAAADMALVAVVD